MPQFSQRVSKNVSEESSMTAVVLLPGMDGSGTLFDDFITALGARSIVIAYPPDQTLNYEALTEFVARRLPSDEDFIVLGESFSGPIAIQVAAKNPSGLRAIVLVCTFAKMRDKPGPRIIRWLICRLPFWRMPVRWGARALLGRGDTQALRDKLLRAVRAVRPEVWRTRMASILTVDVTQQLRETSLPVLYLQASDDRVVPKRASALIAQAQPRTRFAVIEGPHALLQTQPVACANAVLSFATEHSITLREDHVARSR